MNFLQVVLYKLLERQNAVDYPCYIFSRVINNDTELEDVLRDRFFLFTYRKNFCPLPCSSVTSDKGWGCLARSSQMLLAHALWRYSPDCMRLEYFRDTSASSEAPFSLHKMVEAWLQKSDVFRPEYWTPSQGCEAIRTCVKRAVEQEIVSFSMSVVVSSNGGIPAREVCSELAKSKAVLVLTPVRCGLARYMTQMIYFSLEHILSSDACVGVVGGVCSRGYYFLGSSGQRLLYLDPHCMTQEALVSCDAGKSGVVTATKSLLRSVRWDQVDTSCFVGFFLDSVASLRNLQRELDVLKERAMEELLGVEDDDFIAPSDRELVEWFSEEEEA